MSKRTQQKAEMLNEVQIAEINEIFTLFDKNSDGQVTTSELGTIVRGLGFNPSEREVADMQKDVDPNQNGSFDKNSLISLIARRPKQDDSLEKMKHALQQLAANDGQNEEEKGVAKISYENFKTLMTTQNRDFGETLLDHYVTEIVTDSKLLHEEYIIIDDFAQYLMSK